MPKIDPIERHAAALRDERAAIEAVDRAEADREQLRRAKVGQLRGARLNLFDARGVIERLNREKAGLE